MKFVILCNDTQWDFLSQSNKITWKRVSNELSFFEEVDADAFFNLMENASELDYSSIKKPLIINSVIKTLSQIKCNPNSVRINAWNRFIEKNYWEISGIISAEIENVFNSIEIKYIIVNDIPGLVSARVIAMIVNEAFFALEDNVSKKAEIDIAMKLGTNYPYGPFEWAKIIGINNIYNLLTAMAKEDKKYTPSSKMKSEINN